MVQQELSCTANKCSTNEIDDLEAGNEYLTTPSKLSFDDEGNPVTPCAKSLFDETSSTDETMTANTDRYHVEGGEDRTPDDLSDTSGIPKHYTSPVPIPIQHCSHGSSLQRPATQLSNADDCAEVGQGQEKCNGGLLPQSINQLITAIRTRQTTDTDTSLQRRLHDFERARHLRRDRFDSTSPWGILGMYRHLSGIRADLRWAEQSALRRANGESYIGWVDFVNENDSNKYNNTPFFVLFIVGLSTAMFVYTMYLGNWEFVPLDENPMLGPSGEVLLDAGALNTPLLVIENEWWRLFMPMVLHAGIFHYACNIPAIWFIGGALEKIHGFYNISFLFIISALGGNILSAVFLPNSVTVGASGGIFGLIGVCLADIFVNWDLLFLKLDTEEDGRTTCNHIQVLFCLLADILINIVIGLTPFIDNFAHLGGLMYGIFYALPLVDRLGIHFFGQLGFCFKLQNCSLRLFGFLAGCSLMLVSSLLLLKSDGYTSPCDSCRFISCMPFPFWKDDEGKWWDCNPNLY